MIHVCFCMNDKLGLYSKFVGTTMLSLLENSSAPPQSTCVHILHDNTLTQDNRDKFIYVAGRYNQLVKFYNVDELCPEKVAEISDILAVTAKMRFTIGAYYRFFIPYVLPPEIEKIIYLDGDIIVTLDIKDLWQIELGDKVLGVVTRHAQLLKLPKPGSTIYYESPNYFNSGVLLMNVKAFREEENHLMDTIKYMVENNPKFAMDQEILNQCFAEQTVHLPAKFNRLVKWDRRQKVVRTDGKICHYAHADSMKGLGLDMSDAHNRLWMSYFIKTPWFGADSIGRLFTAFRETCNDLGNYVSKVSSAMSNKKRAFFIEPKQVNSMKKFFSIRDDEEIIIADSEKALDKLLESMNESRGKKIFLVMTKDFMDKAFPFARLTKEGFVLNQDFLKGWELLSAANGEPFDSHPLVKTL